MRKVYIFLIILILLLVLISAFYYIIPRRKVEIYLLYHESIGGGGTGGIINVNILVKNTGNREVDYITGEARVMNKGEVVYNLSINMGGINPGGEEESKGYFIGDQFLKYDIQVNLVYSISGHGGRYSQIYNIDEEYMNVLLTDKIIS